jgi:hypothetical protein
VKNAYFTGKIGLMLPREILTEKLGDSKNGKARFFVFERGDPLLSFVFYFPQRFVCS